MSTIEETLSAWAPRDYVPLTILEHWKVADIGPGQYPLRRADVYIDRSTEHLDVIDLEPGQEIMVGNLTEGLPDIPDKYFDFVWISHCLEHVVELQAAIDTLNRISKRGCMVVPSFAKDSLFHFEEREHFWHCLPNPTDGAPPIFVEHNHGFIERLRDSTVQKAACFLYRTGTQHDCTAERFMRAWYQSHEPDLDIVHHWGEGNPLKAIIIR